MTSMRVADFIMQRLADEGLRHVFVLPGGGAMHLNDALACEHRLTPVPCHHEQACGIAAEAYGRTGHPDNPGFGVALVTTGPGATNVITPVAGAWIDSVPMLVISGQVKRADRLNGRPLRQGGVQEVDIVPMVKSITKYAVTVTDPLDIGTHLDAALSAMKSGRPGPVWIDVPLDVQAAPIDPATLPPHAESAAAAAPTPNLEPVAALLRDAKRPLFLAGHGVRLSGAAASLRRLAESLGVPVATTWNALDILPWTHPLNAGRPGVVALRGANFAVQNCDLLIAVGCRLDNIITAYNPRGFARAATKVVVDVDAAELAKLDMDISQAFAMDAGDFIDALAAATDEAAAPDRTQWHEHIADWKRRYPVSDGRPFPASGPIGHFQFADALSDVVPENTLVGTGSSGLAVEAFYTAFRNREGQRVFLTSGLGAMGYGLPAAIGACLGDDSQPMVAVESDGSLQLNLQELATLTGQRLPICLMVMNNAGYCSIRNTQRNYFEGRYLGTGPEAGLTMPDLAKVAEVYGLPYLLIDDAAGLAEGLARALELPRPCLIDVRLIPDETLAPKCAAIPRADGSIVSMPLEDMSPLLPLDILKTEMIVPLLSTSLEAVRPGATGQRA
ncbi:thiamine pyrophosphate-binding protein [Azoarcus sp. KH32C]|uniref:thiamine pyrophosphate-binding protein n=1 Tax=Azoarcus sp. KH32C TaxID=748247 RepID=UPI0002386928|nr:thiamine pyrophosphate-binding protein [Azoarcus sp. KH32C]BAL23760.1 thiamine pyrophosphate protein TPP binding domain protein [Azoarcus sp. KH32C]